MELRDIVICCMGAVMQYLQSYGPWHKLMSEPYLAADKVHFSSEKYQYYSFFCMKTYVESTH